MSYFFSCVQHAGLAHKFWYDQIPDRQYTIDFEYVTFSWYLSAFKISNFYLRSIISYLLSVAYIGPDFILLFHSLQEHYVNKNCIFRRPVKTLSNQIKYKSVQQFSTSYTQTDRHASWT